MTRDSWTYLNSCIYSTNRRYILGKWEFWTIPLKSCSVLVHCRIKFSRTGWSGRVTCVHNGTPYSFITSLCIRQSQYLCKLDGNVTDAGIYSWSCALMWQEFQTGCSTVDDTASEDDVISQYNSRPQDPTDFTTTIFWNLQPCYIRSATHAVRPVLRCW